MEDDCQDYNFEMSTKEELKSQRPFTQLGKLAIANKSDQ